ncbi:MAG: argininosuccinate synthase [Candidatus Vidania fulgoroideorum]
MIIKKAINKKIGLAFSGGLDTSVAIKWMKNNNNKIFAYNANLEFKNEKNKLKKKAIKLGAIKFKSINCKEKLAKAGIKVIKYRAFCVSSGTGIYFNTTPIARVITTKEISKELKKENINIWSDGSTYKGNDIERFCNYALIANKKIKFYKPWLDKEFIKKFGGRKEIIKYLDKKKKYKKENKYSIDSNILGNTYEGNKIEKLKFNIEKIKFIFCGNINNIKNKSTKFSIEIKKGNPIKINNKKINKKYLIFKILNKIGSKHKLGISDQIEDRIIETKSRGIYEAPAMLILHNIYERLISCIYNKETIKLYRSNGKKIGRLLYEGKWYSEESKLRIEIAKKITSKINGKLKLKITNGNILFINTKIYKHNKYKKKYISMEKCKKEMFTFKDRIGYLNIKKIKI